MEDQTIDEQGVPFDRWIIGQGSDSQTDYVIHMGHPRFVAKFIYEGEEGAEHDALAINIDGTVFFDMLFFEQAPKRQDGMERLLKEANDAILRFFDNDDADPFPRSILTDIPIRAGNPVPDTPEALVESITRDSAAAGTPLQQFAAEDIAFGMSPFTALTIVSPVCNEVHPDGQHLVDERIESDTDELLTWREILWRTNKLIVESIDPKYTDLILFEGLFLDKEQSDEFGVAVYEVSMGRI
jgi:hypothetical protein